MAKKTADLRKLWQEIAQKAGINEDLAAAFDEALGNESVAQAFRQGFVPVSEHHSTLDEVRQEAEARKAELDRWYEQDARPAYETNLAGIERLRQYESTYGPIDSNSSTRADADALGFNSKADLDKYLDDRLRAERAGYIALSKSIPKMVVDFQNRFGEELNLDEVEQLSLKKGLPPDLAYQEYIKPRVEAKRTEEFEAKLAAAKEEGMKEAISKYHLPVESTPGESSPFFNREELVTKDGKPVSEAEEDRQSRASFVDGWNNYAEEIASRHRS